MSVSWTILQDESYKSFASLKLGNLRRSDRSQSVGTVSIVAPGANVDSAALWAYGDSVTIKRDSAIWFVGRVIQVPRVGAATEEELSYKLADPWWYLENLLFQQQWKLWNEEEEETTLQYKGRVILGQDSAGNRIDAGEQIREILQYAITAGAPFQIGTIGPDVEFPWEEGTNMLCSEAIKRVLRWSPDASTWFDFATVPPTFHCIRRAALSPVTLDIAQGSPNERLDIVSREDLQVPAVVIAYEQTHQVDDLSYESTILDPWPTDATGREFGELAFTIELSGSRLISESVTIETEAIPDVFPILTEPHTPTGTELAWWVARFPWMGNPEVSDLVIDTADRESASIEEAEVYPNELMKGSIEPWMHPATNPEGHTKHAGYDQIWAYVSYTISQVDATGNTVRKVEQHYVVYKFVATDLVGDPAADPPTGTYKHNVESDGGEPVPVGLAHKFYDSVHPLQFEGQFSLVEEEVTGAVGMGNTLNLSNGLSTWASMNAWINGIDCDVDQGRTTISFGPPQYLGPQDLIEKLRAGRGRVTSTRWKARSTGDSFDAQSGVEEDSFVPKADVTEGAGETKEETFRDNTDEVYSLARPGGRRVGAASEFERKITIRPRDISKTDADVEIKAREVYVLDSALTSLKKRQVLCSAPYDAEKLTQITVVTAIQYDTSSHQIQAKTRTVRAIDVGSETGWTAITGGQAEVCPTP